jgi:hypothetical protein
LTPSIPVLLYHWQDDVARCSADRRSTVSRASFEAHEDVMLASVRAVTISAHAVRRRQPGPWLGWGA